MDRRVQLAGMHREMPDFWLKPEDGIVLEASVLVLYTVHLTLVVVVVRACFFLGRGRVKAAL